MIDFTNVVHINRAVRDVYAYLADLEHTPEWNWAITETRKTTPGPIRVGTRYRQSRTVPFPATEELQIVALDPDSHIEVEGTLARFEARISYRLEERAGRTELTNSVALEATGALRLAAPVFGPRIQSAVADNLADLKARLESAARQDATADLSVRSGI